MMKGMVWLCCGMGLAMAVGCQGSVGSSPARDAKSAGTKVGGNGSAQKSKSDTDRDTNSGTDRVDAASRAFRAGDGLVFASHYAEDAVMVLSDGTLLPASALANAAQQAGPTVKVWSLDDRQHHHTPHGGWTKGRTQTVIQTNAQSENSELITINGTRVIAWKGTGPGARIQADLSLPGGGGEVPTPIARRLDTLAAAWNGHDALAVKSHFTVDASFVLSDARHVSATGLGALLDAAFKQGLESMEYRPTQAWQAGEEGYFVSSDFRFAMYPGDSAVKVEGCQLDFWRRVRDEWKIAVTVSQPADSPACLGRL